ncbi:hypothetical protein [Methylibium rhizosphaerae]|uniref:hypothetical protein n=1 Tax=Methylibium rhizosphaerae TaxID=2570323 RepID=UPI001127B870|nr:hypothetical protein [Methylibium rhizosphaerae]
MSRPSVMRWLRRWVRGLRPAPASSRVPQPAAKGRADLPEPLLMLMQGQLATLLARHPRARRTLPHLAFVEKMLRRSGEAGLWALPDPVLARALQQLEALTDDWSQAGISELRTRLSKAARPAPQVEHDNLLSTFGTPDKLQVCEVGLSVFEEYDGAGAAAHRPR